MRLTVRSTHKWIALFIGAVFLIWVVSGVVLMTPSFKDPARREVAIDYRTAVVSPAEAIRSVAGPDSTGATVRSLALVRVGTRPAYQLGMTDGRTQLVDATSGRELRITAELAESLARLEVGNGPALVRVEAIGGRDAAGQPMAYRVMVADPASTWIEVSRRDGSVWRRSARSRFQDVMSELHTFEAVRALYAGPRGQYWLVVTAGTASLTLILTGYWLILPRRLRRRVAPADNNRDSG
jgi:uncharacterized iron-regulated membrane protein